VIEIWEIVKVLSAVALSNKSYHTLDDAGENILAAVSIPFFTVGIILIEILGGQRVLFSTLGSTSDYTSRIGDDSSEGQNQSADMSGRCK
jgi:hypothetical protein